MKRKWWTRILCWLGFHNNESKGCSCYACKWCNEPDGMTKIGLEEIERYIHEA